MSNRPSDSRLGELRGKSFCVVTLGCFRNEVESDLLISELSRLGLRQTSTLEASQVIIVNTCGFIQEACEEGIDTILEIDRLTRSRDPRPPILLVGCMGQRYGCLLYTSPSPRDLLCVDL